MARRPRRIRAWTLSGEAPAAQGNAALVEAVLDHEMVLTLGALPLLVPI